MRRIYLFGSYMNGIRYGKSREGEGKLWKEGGGETDSTYSLLNLDAGGAFCAAVGEPPSGFVSDWGGDGAWVGTHAFPEDCRLMASCRRTRLSSKRASTRWDSSEGGPGLDTVGLGGCGCGCEEGSAALVVAPVGVSDRRASMVPGGVVCFCIEWRGVGIDEAVEFDDCRACCCSGE